VPSEQVPSDYVDRPELTDALLAYLLSHEPASKGRAIISAVHGLGGIGKTTVARWLVWQPEIEQRFPDGRVWITLGGETDAPDAITVIAECVGQLDPALKSKATVEAARADLSALLQDRSVLLIIDDVWPGKSAEVAKALIVPSAHSRFLLTTRFPQLADDPDIRAEDFPLDEMNNAQATELIVRAVGRELNADEHGHANRLCQIVGRHPLALELAAARIKDGRPWAALLNDLDAEIARLEALEEADDDLVAEPMGGEANRRRTSIRASLLLSVRCLSRPGQRLFAWLGVVAEEAVITPRVAATLWSVPEETARRHLRTLSGLGLLSVMGDGYAIHDLMHDLARELLTAPETAARAGGIAGFALTMQGAVGQLLERYRAKMTGDLWHTLSDDGYIHDHLIRHFEQAGWESELEGLLWEESADGHCGLVSGPRAIGADRWLLGGRRQNLELC
jgi:NB-ARC domain